MVSIGINPYLNINQMAGTCGFEPQPSESKSDVLPLDDAPLMLSDFYLTQRYTL